MDVTFETKVGAILDAYGDIADVMETLGIKRVSRFSVRRLIAKAITVKQAARIHGVPPDEFLALVRKAVAIEENRRRDVAGRS